VTYPINESFRPEDMNSLLAANEHPQKLVETNEMIDMGMRDEDLLDAVNLPRRQRRDVSEVE